jgi:hypothetical protein
MRSVNDLQLMFLERVAIETPDATSVLFNYGDAGRPLINLMAARGWVEYYGASADWLETFLQDALEQAHIDWIETEDLRRLVGRLCAKRAGRDKSPYVFRPASFFKWYLQSELQLPRRSDRR